MVKSRAGKVVPVALHSELSEYASLIRALRTNDALDITSQLTRPVNTPSTLSVVDEDKELQHPVSEPPAQFVSSGEIPPVSSPPDVDESSVSGINAVSGQGKRRLRDTWTRWPLLASDVLAPEWQLRDEVQLIASRVLSAADSSSSGSSAHPQRTRSSGSSTSSMGAQDEEDEAPLPRTALDALAFSASVHLSNILAAMAARGPRAGESMFPRAYTLSWREVLSAVEAQGIADTLTVAKVRQRMNNLTNGTSSSHYGEDCTTNVSVKGHKNARLAAAEDGILRLAGSRGSREPARKRRKYRMQKRKAAHTDEDSATQSSED